MNGVSVAWLRGCGAAANCALQYSHIPRNGTSPPASRSSACVWAWLALPCSVLAEVLAGRFLLVTRDFPTAALARLIVIFSKFGFLAMPIVSHRWQNLARACGFQTAPLRTCAKC